MKISIITPCYNAEKYIDETLQSILCQKGDFEIEHIIIDGGSVDKTLSLIENYQKMSQNSKSLEISVILKSENDRGMYDALAKGLKIATGDIITYLNADDYYLPNALSVIVEVFRKYQQIDWITGCTVQYNHKGEIIGSFLPFKYCRKLIQKGAYGTKLPFIPQESTFWRAKLNTELDFKKLATFKYAGDFYLWYTFSKIAELRIINAFIAGYRIHNNQISAQKEKYLSEFRLISDNQNLLDKVNIIKQRISNFLLNQTFKIRFNKEIICYGKNDW